MAEDLDALLQAQESTVVKEAEVERILACCPKDYFAVLEINPLIDPASISGQVKKLFRKKSLLIHPDKLHHKDAPEAFDLLKKAELILSIDHEPEDDEGKRLFAERAALVYIYEKIADSLDIEPSESFHSKQNVEIRAKVQEALEHQQKSREFERSFLQRQEAKKQEEVHNAAKDRDLRKKWELRWEDDRDLRVNLWRQYKVEKSKKKKPIKKKTLI